MQTLRYLYIMLRWPSGWRNTWWLLWGNTIPGRWLWYVGACIGAWPENAGDRDWAQRNHGNSMWQQLWWMSVEWEVRAWRMRVCRVMGHIPGEDDGYHLWCKRCKHDARHEKENCGWVLLQEMLWAAIRGGCFGGGVIVVVYYGAWPLFKWLVRMALQ